MLGGEDATPQPRRHAQTLPRPTPQRKLAPETGMAQSRLQAQPWPPGMGQPLATGQGGVTHTNPALGTPSTAPVVVEAKAKISVALLLPLSGKHAALGQAMLNAAQMAVFDLASANFELMPRDTRGTPEGAVAAARDAVASGAQLLIGPLFAADVAAVKPVAQSSGVNMMALSTDVSLGESGAWVMGFAPAPQVERVITYARRQGLYRFAAIIPKTPYGAIVRDAFEKTAQELGTSRTMLDNPAELTARLAKGESFDALFLPLGGNELRTVAAQLAANGFDAKRIRLLGTGLWDEAGLGQSVPLLVGGWYAASEPDARERFMASYKNAYNAEPPRLATLAYDATALAAVLSRRGASFDRVSLANANGFAGMDGLFRLTPQGTAERGLAVNEITPTGSRVIDPAPSTFAGR